MLSKTGFCLCAVNDLQELLLAGRPLHRDFEVFRRQFELLKSCFRIHSGQYMRPSQPSNGRLNNGRL